MKYLNDKTWTEVTREERYFCAELFFEMRKNIVPFLELIGKSNGKTYEVGFEVCLYRDVLKAYSISIKAMQLPQKRTFDLVLMSDDEIIIIEAKAKQGFDTEQLEYFQNDIVEHIPKLFEIINQSSNLPSIILVAIHSSLYKPKKTTQSIFKNLITWKQLAQEYSSSNVLFKRADLVYKETKEED